MLRTLLNSLVINFLFCFCLYASPDQSDSLRNRINQLDDNDTVKVTTLLSLVSVLQQQGRYQSAVSYAEEAFQLAAAQHENSLSEADAALRLGSLLSDRARHDDALKYLFRASAIYQKKNNAFGHARTLNNIAAVYYELKQYDDVFKYMNQALQVADQLQDNKMMAVISGNIGNLYAQRGEFEKARIYIEQAIDLRKEENDKQGQAYALNFLGNVYEQLGQTDKAEQNYKEALALELETNEQYLMVFSYQNLSQLYRRKGRLAEAAEFLQKAETSASAIGASKELAKIYLAYADLAEAEGNYKTAYQWHKKHKQLNDSIFSSDRSRQIAEMQTAYESDIKDAKIQTLSQEAEIQKLELERQRAWMYGAVPLSIAISGLLYIYNRNRKLIMQNKLLSAEQRMRRAQMNPHFFFNALMAIQQFVNRADTLKASSYIAKFAKLMRQVLNFSEKEFTTLNEEIEMLEYYVQLQQLRFENAFECNIDIDEHIDAESTLIPVMLLQPLVENAIEHGLRSKNGEGQIKLSFTDRQGMLHIYVEDNGSGFVNNTHSGKQHQSMATQIITDRIRILQQRDNFGVKYHTNGELPEGGTRVELIMPIKTS